MPLKRSTEGVGRLVKNLVFASTMGSMYKVIFFWGGGPTVFVGFYGVFSRVFNGLSMLLG